MKKILAIIVITTLFGCFDDSKPVIRQKIYNSSINNLPSCICVYTYSGGGAYEWTSFQDSCNKYNLFDTLTGIKKK